jgi:hypothetical protein
MKTTTKIILTILISLYLVNTPYSYYQFVCFISSTGFIVLAYSYQQKREIEIIVCVALAILFQPLSKIVLGRIGWNIVDAIVEIGLIVSLFITPNKEKNEYSTKRQCP